MAKKKLTQILYSGLGGHGNIAFSVIEGDVKNDVEHELIFYGIEDVVEDYKAKCKELNVNSVEAIKERGKHIKSFRLVYRALKQSNPDVVVIHSSNAIIAAIFYGLFNRAEVTFVEHQPNEIKSKQEWFLSIFAMLFAHNIFLNSTLYQKNLKKAIGIFFKRKVNIIPNGLDLDKFTDKDKQLNPKTYNITMAARLVNTKDHATLIRAFGNFLSDYPQNNVQLNIAGNGEKEKELKQLTKDLKLQDLIVFHGLLNESDLINLYKKTNLYIHATLGETMSTSIMQSLSMGLPSIVSDIPGTRHMLIDEQTTLLVPPKDVNALTQQIQRLYENPDLAQKLGKEARIYAEQHFDKNLMFKNYLSALNL